MCSKTKFEIYPHPSVIVTPVSRLQPISRRHSSAAASSRSQHQQPAACRMSAKSWLMYSLLGLNLLGLAGADGEFYSNLLRRIQKVKKYII